MKHDSCLFDFTRKNANVTGEILVTRKKRCSMLEKDESQTNISFGILV